jgi:hypothetical protein
MEMYRKTPVKMSIQAHLFLSPPNKCLITLPRPFYYHPRQNSITNYVIATFAFLIIFNKLPQSLDETPLADFVREQGVGPRHRILYRACRRILLGRSGSTAIPDTPISSSLTLPILGDANSDPA